LARARNRVEYSRGLGAACRIQCSRAGWCAVARRLCSTCRCGV
jgi:hypothetical protein